MKCVCTLHRPIWSTQSTHIVTWLQWPNNLLWTFCSHDVGPHRLQGVAYLCGLWSGITVWMSGRNGTCHWMMSSMRDFIVMKCFVLYRVLLWIHYESKQMCCFMHGVCYCCRIVIESHSSFSDCVFRTLLSDDSLLKPAFSSSHSALVF